MSVHWGGPGAGHVSRWSVATTGVPVLSLDFLTSNTLDPRVTFTRSTTATFVGSDGLIQTAAINAPRFDYNPVTLAPNGLLIEEQRVNLFLNSLINGTSLSTQSVTVTAVAHTISFYGTGTITLSGAAVATVTGTGIYPSRRTLTFTPTIGVLVCTVTGSVQYAQIEAGLFATSFIPTAGSTVTRAADIALMTGTNFSSWYNASEGSIVAAFDVYSPSAVDGFGRVYQIDDTTNNNAIALTKQNGNTLFFGIVSVAGATQAQLLTSALSANTPAKVATAYKLNDFGQATNGGTLVTDTSGTIPTVTQIRLGSLTSGVSSMNGHIRTITYYSSRLTNAQLQALTA